MKKICLALVTAAIALCAFFFQHKVQAIIDWTNTLGSLAPVFFLILYCLASILFLPTMVLTLAGGALWPALAERHCPGSGGSARKVVAGLRLHLHGFEQGPAQPGVFP